MLIHQHFLNVGYQRGFRIAALVLQIRQTHLEWKFEGGNVYNIVMLLTCEQSIVLDGGLPTLEATKGAYGAFLMSNDINIFIF